MPGVLDSIEFQILSRADYLTTLFPAQYEILTAFHSCKRVTLQGCYTVSYSLLSFTFATQWKPKHPSYVSTRLFCKSTWWHEIGLSPNVEPSTVLMADIIFRFK